jgi:hypothetical protein
MAVPLIEKWLPLWGVMPITRQRQNIQAIKLTLIVPEGVTKNIREPTNLIYVTAAILENGSRFGMFYL